MMRTWGQRVGPFQAWLFATAKQIRTPSQALERMSTNPAQVPGLTLMEMAIANSLLHV